MKKSGELYFEGTAQINFYFYFLSSKLIEK